jgi:hypothetical protein
MVPKKQGKSYGNPLKPKRACTEFDLDDKVKILDLWEGDMSLTEAGWCYGENESNILSIEDKEDEI